MSKTRGTKRKLPSQNSRPDKKSKFGSGHTQSSVKGKEKAAQRTTIPIPEGTHDDELQLSDQDMDVIEEHGDGIGFLTNLDHKAIARSKNHIQKLHQLSKPARPKEPKAHVLSDSEDENFGFSDSDISDTELSFVDSNATPSSTSEHSDKSDDSDIERTYEKGRPNKTKHAGEEDTEVEVPRLPIKLPDGTVQQTGNRRIPKSTEPGPPPKFYTKPSSPPPVVDDVSTGARFGRAAVIDVVTIKDRKRRIEVAKDQLASVCQDIIADPENSLGLLRRLHSFALPEISSPTQPDAVSNDPIVRKYAILSQLAVFKDIIPGYRIRSLSDHEKAEKVTQAVMRTREWEQGLVGAYQKFLANAESEIKAKSELYNVALTCMCTMLLNAPHFNFRADILSTIITQLSRKSWTEVSEQCYATLVTLFQRDLTGEVSLDAVRHLNRMIKERRFAVHPRVLSCLLHLRLKTELHDVRASQSRASKDDPAMGTNGGKPRKKDRPHLSKKAKKALKENKAIQAEMKEAEAEVNKEERANRHTETLKLLFVIYFSILKLPSPLASKLGIQLTCASLQGIAKFAHLVNVDFFRDLMAVLRELVGVCKAALGDGTNMERSGPGANAATDGAQSVERRSLSQDIVKLELKSICTAFELLTGQGEALNIDLESFITDLFNLLPLLPFVNATNDDQGETHPTNRLQNTNATATASMTIADDIEDLLFQSLKHVLLPPNHVSAAHTPLARITSFSTRLLNIAPYLLSVSLVLKILETIQALLVKYPALDTHLDSEDGAGGAWYTLFVLEQHVDERVVKETRRVINFKR